MTVTVNTPAWYSAAQEAVVTGGDFGNRAACSGNTDFITLADLSRGGEAGHTGDFQGLNVISSTDTPIVFFYPTSITNVGTDFQPLDLARTAIVEPNATAGVNTLAVTIHEPTSLTSSPRPGSDAGP